MSYSIALVRACQQCSHATDTVDPSHHRDTPGGGHDRYTLLWVDGTWLPSITKLEILLITKKDSDSLLTSYGTCYGH